MPKCERRSGRFGVTSITIRVSPTGIALKNGVPGAASVSSSRMPTCSSESPSSRAEQSMPFEIAPRIFRFSSLSPPGSVLPAGANGYFLPAVTFGAPHTTSSSSPVPASTFVTER